MITIDRNPNSIDHLLQLGRGGIRAVCATLIAVSIWLWSPTILRAAGDYVVCVSNERSDDVTVFDGATQRIIATLPVGKRPRGLHASPDGRWFYVALSGSPIAGP